MHGLAIPVSATVASMRTTLSQKGKTDMRTIMRNSISLPMAAILLTVALAGQAVAADKLVPFSGSLHAKESIVLQGVPPGTFVADGSGGGDGTLLGLFSLGWEVSGLFAGGPGGGAGPFLAAHRG